MLSMRYLRSFCLIPTLSFAVVVGFGFATELQAGETSPGGTTKDSAGHRFSAEVVQRDLETLYGTLQSAHYYLFAHRSEAAYARHYRKALASIDGPMSRLEALKLFTAFVAYGKIGHARANFPIQDYRAHVESGGKILPLDIRVEGGKTFITHVYGDAPPFAPGVELEAVDGRSITHWLVRVGRYVSSERLYMTHAQLEAMFPRLVWMVEGDRDAFEVTVRDEAGKKSTHSVDAVPVMTLEEHKGELQGRDFERKAERLEDKIAYLHPGPFFALGDETLDDFETFVDDAFESFLKAGAQDLVLDLRNNPGGDNSFSDPMIAWFAHKPFRFASRFKVKTSPQTREVLEGLAAKDPDGISAEMLKMMRQHQDGEIFDFEIPKAQPRQGKRFEGRVWILINRHSYSNATTVAAIVKDNGFGTVIGEETADVPTTYASSAQFTLPETGLTITYPKAYFVRPNGNEDLRGVVPDHALTFPLLASDEDPVLQEALALIRSQRPSGASTGKTSPIDG